MACQAMHSWTFTGLVCAFLDLGIAYFLLCVSTLAFLASKFLGFFGLFLPCPCNGLFGNHNTNYCVQRLLVEYPSEKVSSVLLSVESKFPFDLICALNQNYQLNFKLVGERNNNISGIVEIEGGDSSRPILDAENSQKMVGNETDYEFEGTFDVKGKGVMNQMPKGGLRRHRKDSVDNNMQGGPPSPSSINKEDMARGNLVSVNSGADANCSHNGGETLVPMELEERAHGFELDDPLDGSKAAEKDSSSVDEPCNNVQGETSFYGKDKNIITDLEQALEEERAARDALCLELEKERSASATAADEAMAMILRLQEAKASIEMEARQYQRIIEEKSAYDDEEMNILKEIIVGRETEKYFLEKELEAYRQVNYIGNEQFNSSLDEREDPALMLHEISESIGKNEIARSGSENNKSVLANGKALPIQEWAEGNMEFQEKSVVSMDANSPQREGQISETYPLWHESSTSQEHNHAIETRVLTETHISLHDESWGKHGKDKENENECSNSLMLDMETCVHDVHVIDDKPNTYCKSDIPSESSEIRKNKGVSDTPSTSRIEATELKNDRENNSNKTVLSDLRRNSVSAVENVRLMIDTEVVCLREKLKIVQEEREKLNFSTEHRERGKVQLQLLEDIARQLQEIRQLTEPGKAVRQASLPPPSTKNMSKKRGAV